MAATVLIASGDIHTEDLPIHDRDIATQFLRLTLGVIEMTDVTFILGGAPTAHHLCKSELLG